MKIILVNLARLISFVSNPAFVVVAALMYVIGYYAETPGQFWVWSAAGSVLLVLPGLIYAFVIWHKERHIDLDLSDRHDRIVPLVAASLGGLLGSYLISTRLNDQSLALLGYVLVAQLIALTVITLAWKISLHATTLSTAISLLVVFRGGDLAYLYLLLLPVAWSRLTLKQHTPAQVLGGMLVGVGVTYLLGLVFVGSKFPNP